MMRCSVAAVSIVETLVQCLTVGQLLCGDTRASSFGRRRFPEPEKLGGVVEQISFLFLQTGRCLLALGGVSHDSQLLLGRSLTVLKTSQISAECEVGRRGSVDLLMWGSGDSRSHSGDG